MLGFLSRHVKTTGDAPVVKPSNGFHVEVTEVWAEAMDGLVKQASLELDWSFPTDWQNTLEFARLAAGEA